MKTDNLAFRYGEDIDAGDTAGLPPILGSMLSRGSCREFTDKQVDANLFRLLCAAAMASPTKSDLQQRDIILLQARETRSALVDLVADQAWIRGAPAIAVFCGNNRRQRCLHELRGHPFANDHLDAFFNAAVDAAIALSAFVTAAEAIGLGCCPISAVRNNAVEVSDLLGLPDHVFPVAGLAFGYPAAAEPTVSMRLPLSVTVHEDRFHDPDPKAAIAAYDARRQRHQPYDRQRAEETFGTSGEYGWSEDKSRQYALPERQDFGTFIRSKGFKLT